MKFMLKVDPKFLKLLKREISRQDVLGDIFWDCEEKIKIEDYQNIETDNKTEKGLFGPEEKRIS